MSDPTKSEGGKPTKGSGGADATTLVRALVRVSGPDYVIEQGKTGQIPSKYADKHIEDGTAEGVKNND